MSCTDYQVKVNQDNQTLAELRAELNTLEADLAKAPAVERPGIRLLIELIEKRITAATEQLAVDEAALNKCLEQQKNPCAGIQAVVNQDQQTVDKLLVDIGKLELEIAKAPASSVPAYERVLQLLKSELAAAVKQLETAEAALRKCQGL